MGGTVLTVSSRALLDSCERLGIDTSALLRATGLTREIINDPDHRLSEQQVKELWRLAYQASGDTNLALHAAETLPFGAYRVIDYLAASAPTVGDAISHVAAYFPIINSAVRLVIDQHVNQALDQSWVIDYRIYQPLGDGKSKLEHVANMIYD